MSYDPQWSNGSGGRLTGGVHHVCLSDAEEIGEAVNRRRGLIYRPQQDFSSYIHSGAWVRHSPLDGLSVPFQDFRGALAGTLLSPTPGELGGEPPSPTAMQWLHPTSGDVLVFDSDPDEGYANFFEAVNGGTLWTDPSLAGRHIRAVHVNELRAATELLRRGRWQMPVYLSCGIFSMLPDTPWVGGALANNGTHELRTLGFAYLSRRDEPTLGLRNVEPNAASQLVITSSRPCSVQVYHCLRSIDWVTNPPTWNSSRPGVQDWTAPGGLGAGDAESIGAADISEEDGYGNYIGEVSGGGLAAALQAMVDGGQENFLIRRTDTSDPVTALLTAELTVEFDLDTPPN